MSQNTKKNLAGGTSEASASTIDAINNPISGMTIYIDAIKTDMEREKLSVNSEQSLTGFSSTKATRNTSGSSLERDMVLFMPGENEEYVVYDVQIGENTAQYALIPTNKGVIRLFPGVFQRVAYPVDSECVPIPGQRVVSNGTACEEFSKHANIKDAMNALRGRKISVDKIEPVRVRKYGTIGEFDTTNIYTLNFVN